MVKLNMTFPEGFFEEEERCGHLVSRETKKIWAVDLDLLREFMRVCDKHKIKWWIEAGTLLGAVRHKGFIPWDDDMDVIMMRDEYERFCKIAKDEFKSPYSFLTSETLKGYLHGVGRLRNDEATNALICERNKAFNFDKGICLDISPIDCIPDDNKLLEKQAKNILRYHKKARFLRNIAYTYNFKWRKNLIKLFWNYFLHLLYIGPLHSHADFSVPQKKYEDECRKYSGTETNRVCKTVNSIEPKRIWSKNWLDETVYLPFEMFQLPAPKEYVRVLDAFYGDWHSFMKRNWKHVNAIFDAEIEYIGGYAK